MTGFYVAVILVACAIPLLIAAFAFHVAGREVPEALCGLAGVLCMVIGLATGVGWFVLRIAEILAKAAS